MDTEQSALFLLCKNEDGFGSFHVYINLVTLITQLLGALSCICGLFNYIVSSSDYIALNDKVISELERM
jgi:hypothetical protein